MFYIVKAQFSSWDKVHNFIAQDNYQVKDWVVVETENGEELAKIIAIEETDKSDNNLEKVIRSAKKEEVEIINDQEKIDNALSVCRQLIEKHNLDMKLIDARFSFSAKRLNFAFISDGRVDFRELVKDLSGHFNLNIRLTQIGTRDEAKISGDCGSCGRKLCCKGFINEFNSISSEMAESQQVVHRGSDRISGSCGRLMCCLSFEYEGYKELSKNLPAIGEKIKVDGRQGKVIGHHVLKQTVDVLVSDGKNGDGKVVIEVDPKDNSINNSKKR